LEEDGSGAQKYFSDAKFEDFDLIMFFALHITWISKKIRL
jgi:hypothetical protein